MTSDMNPGPGSGSVPDQATVASVTMPPNLTIPDWFLSNNVKTVEQLADTEPNIFLKDLAEKETGKEGLKHDYAKDAESAFSVCSQTFLSARDTLACCLVRDVHGQLETHNNGVRLELRNENSAEILTEYVDALAKELGATLVTVTLHDFQALAATYRDQTPPEFRQDLKPALGRYKIKLHPSFDLVCHYFGNRCLRNATDVASERSKQAFGTILHVQGRNTGDEESIGAKRSAKSRERPLLIHVAEARLLEEDDQGIRVLARLRDAVFEERKSGRPVILVMTQGHWEGCFSSDRLSKKSGIPTSAVLSIKHFDVPAAREKPNTKVSARFIDDLKFLLRFYAWNHFDAQTLLHNSKWKLKLDDKVGSFNHGDKELLESVAQQITGRAVDGRRLALDDVEQVLYQVSIGQKTENGKLDSMPRGEVNEDEDGKSVDTNSEESESVASSEDDDDSEIESDKPAPPDFDDLNKHEKALVDSIVKVEELQATKYEDVILNDDIKDIIKQLVLLSRMKIDVKSPLMMSAVQISGALLYGPPGTGKTHLSRAIANSLGSNMLALDSATLTNCYVGETEKYIKAAFSLARKYDPCILFLDEVDALFYRRSSSDKSWQRAALTQFLQEVDGLRGGQPGAPFVLVATNRPMDLDTAFLRRLPQKIHFELPDANARAQILRVLLNAEDLAPDVDMDHLASLTEGYSGSDLKNLCAEAALLWVLEMSRKEAAEAARRAEASKCTGNEAPESNGDGSAVVDSDAASPTAAKSQGTGAVKDLGAAIDATNGDVAETNNITVENSANHDSSNGAGGSNATETAVGEDAAGADPGTTNDGENNEAANEPEEKTKKQIEKEKKKTEAEARAVRRREREDKRAAEAAHMAKLNKVCLTNALFEKALQRMRPTVSPQAIKEIAKFAKMFSEN